jgi:hypothetical protein
MLAFGGDEGIMIESFSPETVLSRLKLRPRTRFAGVSVAS